MTENNYHRIYNIVRSCILAAAVICMSAAMVLAGTAQVFAVGEYDEEASDGYEPSEYRYENENINEWEDRVLIAATGELKNEGRVYYAYGDYVNELISYFTKDDLELTEKDAKNAIAEITDPKNARAGAQSGYLYQIGGKPKDADSLVDNGEYDGKLYPEFDAEKRFANEEEYLASDLYRNNKAYIEERTNTVYESQAAMRKEMRELAEADRTYEEILSERPSDANVTAIIAPKGGGIAVAAAAVLLFILTIATIVYGWRNSTISALADIDDESWKRHNSHKDRHRIRKRSAAILAAVVAVDLAIICSGFTYYTTLGSNNYIEASMDRGGICQHSYMEFRDDVHKFLSKNSLPQNALDRALTYRDYRFDYIKGTRSAIKNGSDEVTYRGVQESVEAQIDLLAYVTKKDGNKVIDGINKLYEDSLSAKAGVFVYDLRSSLGAPYVTGFVFSVISLLLAAVMLVFERHNIYKGIRNLAVGAIAGTAIWAVISAVVLLIPRETPAMADDHVYVMLNTASDSIAPSMLILLGVSAAVSLILFGVSWLMQRRS